MFVLKAKKLKLEAKKPIVILNGYDAAEMDLKPLERVELRYRNSRIMAIVNIAEKFVSKGYIGIYESIWDRLGVQWGSEVTVSPTEPPKSLEFIKSKLDGEVLKSREIYQIIEDVVNHRVSEVELTSFVTGLYYHGMTMDEAAAMSNSMARTGKILRLRKTVYDKHSLGGIPGDKTSILLVPLIAAAGMAIPKTSSRAITSPAGTADRFECICPVELELEEIKRVVNKTNGCLVWGGAVDFAPADDIFIQIEYPLSIDPLLLPSIMSKKMAVSSNYVVIDIPTGAEAKIKTVSGAEDLAEKFIELGSKLGIKVVCVSTFGEQPMGYAIGPALEAREALETIISGRGPQDLTDKVAELAGVLLGFRGAKNGKAEAMRIMGSEKYRRKFRQIVEAQGGNPDIRPGDIPVGQESAEVRSRASGKVFWIDNKAIAKIARDAGAPRNKGAGVLLHKKMGDKVKRGEVIFEIFSEKGYKLNRALETAEAIDSMGIGKKLGMVLKKIPKEEERKRYFILER